MHKGGANMTALGDDGFSSLHWVAMVRKPPRAGVHQLRALRWLLVRMCILTIHDALAATQAMMKHYEVGISLYNGSRDRE
eukprot:SAG31_NODE_273_length_18667_cov_3.603619_9_plen_80_part_00